MQIEAEISCSQWSTMGKKIWLSMHPRNFGFDKIVSQYVHPYIHPYHVSRCEMAPLLGRIQRHLLSECQKRVFADQCHITVSQA